MNPVAPENCTDFDLGELAFNPCAPKVRASQLRRLLIGKPNAAPLEDWTSAASWTGRISQTSKDGDDYIRVLTVTGEKPTPANVTRKIENGITIGQGKDHTVNFTTYQVTDENYEFMRQTEVITQVRLFGIETMGGIMLGSNVGQLAFIVMDDNLPGGDDDLENLTGSLTWRAKNSLERTESPIFDIDFNVGGSSIPSTFDTNISLDATTSATAKGVTATAGSTDPDLKFAFNGLTNPVGTPQNMVIKVGGVNALSVDFPSDYGGAGFRFTDTAGATHTSTFVNGTKNF
jgi:hypothetical protein